MTAPALESARITTLDATRGVAVIGILLMNIISFSMPMAAYTNPLAWGGTGFADISAFVASGILVDSKMRGLFSLLFGASMVLVVDRAVAKGDNGGKVHFLRMITLLVIGLCHMYLVWYGDILTAYALCGMVAYLFIHQSPRTLVKIALVFFGLSFAIWAMIGGSLWMLSELAARGPLPADLQESWEQMKPMLGGTETELRAEVASLLQNYTGVLTYRANHQAMPMGQFMLFGAETIGLMLIGAAMQRSGFFSGGWDRPRLKRLAWRLGLPAIVVLTLLYGWLWASGFPPAASFLVSMPWSAPFDYMLAIAYAAIIVLLVSQYANARLVQRLAAAGRAAFTNYLGTSVVMTTIFYGYGLGLFGSIDRAPVYLFVVAAAVVMLAWSKPWLDRFHYGPMEWLWRSLARGQIQTLRRAAI